MAEIKSTLDLVMERTRDLSLSEEEKAAQQKEAFEKRLQGLLQQYADQALNPKSFQQERDALESEYRIHDPGSIVQAVGERIDPSGDNRRWLDLLAALVPQVVSDLETLLTEHRNQGHAIEVEAMARSARMLSQQHAISGAAVLSNTEKDQQFRDQRDRLENRTRTRIKEMLHRAQNQEASSQ
ncbi:hypothetical protein [Desulfatitalea alkaliphila]|uniref:Uncharacterized protein n=1 Tax=Desulfatitalea alkaliphila TaxID=2929485 RepID=A0AA41UL97_9BACT|nr:hypothetical protein [Desulfatitalea alkaliphila]MCJ8502242.1 hypothetical protein [Desulfatitalea alkaliphila]